MRIVEFDQGMEREVVDLWNRCLVADQVTLERFRRQVLWDENFDAALCLAAVSGDSRVKGLVLATKRKFPYHERGLEPARGWINLMFVAEEDRRRGVGSALLGEAERRLSALGATRVTLAAYSPGYFFRGVDTRAYPEAQPFFEAHGYLPTEKSYPMARDLHAFALSEDARERERRALEAGYRIEPLDYARSLELLAFARDEFGGGWKGNCLDALRDGSAHERILVVIGPDDSIVGFCCRAIDGNPMRFGPIGISSAHRNAGLGGVLLERAMLEMERRGIHHMFFLSTDEGGRRFYERHGLHVVRVLQGYEKCLAERAGTAKTVGE